MRITVNPENPCHGSRFASIMVEIVEFSGGRGWRSLFRGRALIDVEISGWSLLDEVVEWTLETRYRDFNSEHSVVTLLCRNSIKFEKEFIPLGKKFFSFQPKKKCIYDISFLFFVIIFFSKNISSVASSSFRYITDNQRYMHKRRVYLFFFFSLYE